MRQVLPILFAAVLCAGCGGEVGREAARGFGEGVLHGVDPDAYQRYQQQQILEQQRQMLELERQRNYLLWQQNYLRYYQLCTSGRVRCQ